MNSSPKFWMLLVNLKIYGINTEFDGNCPDFCKEYLEKFPSNGNFSVVSAILSYPRFEMANFENPRISPSVKKNLWIYEKEWGMAPLPRLVVGRWPAGTRREESPAADSPPACRSPEAYFPAGVLSVGTGFSAVAAVPFHFLETQKKICVENVQKTNTRIFYIKQFLNICVHQENCMQKEMDVKGLGKSYLRGIFANFFCWMPKISSCN